MDDDEPTPTTLEFPEEAEIELTDDDVIDVMLIWAPVVGEA